MATWTIRGALTGPLDARRGVEYNEILSDEKIV